MKEIFEQLGEVVIYLTIAGALYGGLNMIMMEMIG